MSDELETQSWGSSARAAVIQVYRSCEFAATLQTDGVLDMTADAVTDKVDWESGNGERFACMQCFGELPLPETSKLDFA